MNATTIPSRTRILSSLLLLCASLILLVKLAERVLPRSVGASDFIGYWTGARLLAAGEDPYNAENILAVQRMVDPETNRPMFTWNPPWLNVLMLPLAVMSFSQATTVWLVANILILGICGIGIWWLLDKPADSSRPWVALPVVFLFPQTLTLLDTGQITTLVLAGITGFLIAYEKRHWLLAGVFLTLTTVKPHLVFLWLPLVFLWTLGERRWQVWAGFGLAFTILLSALTWLLPSWPLAYKAILQAPPIDWATPTLGGMVATLWGLGPARYLGLLFMPVIVLLWWKARGGRLVVLSTGLLVVSPTLAVFGWSYDQILLLFPLIAIAVSLVRHNLPTKDICIVAALIGLLILILYLQRLHTSDEVYYFWVPLAILPIYFWIDWRSNCHRDFHTEGYRANRC